LAGKLPNYFVRLTAYRARLPLKFLPNLFFFTVQELREHHRNMNAPSRSSNFSLPPTPKSLLQNHHTSDNKSTKDDHYLAFYFHNVRQIGSLSRQRGA
jgi:hypothetical protein